MNCIFISCTCVCMVSGENLEVKEVIFEHSNRIMVYLLITKSNELCLNSSKAIQDNDLYVKFPGILTMFIVRHFIFPTFIYWFELIFTLDIILKIYKFIFCVITIYPDILTIIMFACTYIVPILNPPLFTTKYSH